MKGLRFDMPLLVGVLGLVSLGMVFIYSSSAAYAQINGMPESIFLASHVKKVILGCFALLLGLVISYRTWHRISRPLMIGALGLLVFLIASAAVGSVNGARRWLTIASFGLQPSELAKMALIFFLARMLSERGEGIRDFKKGLLPSLPISLLAFGLILLQPNYSTAATLAALTVGLLFAAGAKTWHLLSLGLAGLPVLGFLMISSPYRLQRVKAFLDPELNPASSYQSLQSLISLGQGGLFGTGLGTSTQKWGYLPMPFTDTIFAILGEELGLVGTLGCLLLFGWVAYRGMGIAFRCRDSFGSLVALGIILAMAVNVLMHVGVCLKIFPTTGQPLPFVSYGGTALVVALFGMGILLNISGSETMSGPGPEEVAQQKAKAVALASVSRSRMRHHSLGARR
jgi:cell division protein FtsW